jgi:SET domain-containing protein
VAGGANAMLLPFSDNSSGKVYCAVIALRDIAAQEEVCLDYGNAYWEVSQVSSLHRLCCYRLLHVLI